MKSRRQGKTREKVTEGRDIKYKGYKIKEEYI